MLPIRKCNQIDRSVIMLNTVKVMNNPAIGQRFSVRFLPNKDMLLNISTLISVSMGRLADKYITAITECPSTFPLRVFFRWASFQILYHASSTSCCCFVHFATTPRAYFRIMLRMAQTIYTSSLFSFITSVISFQRYTPMFLNTIRTKVFSLRERLKALTAILTYLIYHHKYQFNTNQCESQSRCCYG